MADHSCPKCGMAQKDWKENGGQGVAANGRTYCCRGCAEGSGCTCK